jgi:hypothetical protein
MRKLITLAFCAALVLAAIMWASVGPVHAQIQTAALSGRVVNGTAGASVPAGLQVRVVAQVGTSMLYEQSTTVAADGAFAFSAVPLEPTALYFVTTEHQGASYTTRVDPAQPDAAWRLTIYEATAKADALRIIENTLFIPRAEADSRELVALELVRVENTGDRTLVPDLSQAQPNGLLRFSLPRDAKDIDVQAATLTGGNVVPVDKGFAITTPIPPGAHDLAFSYRVPYTSRMLDYTRTFPFGAQGFELLIGVGAGKASGPEIPPGREIVVDGAQYYNHVLRDIPPGGRVELSITDIPQPTFLRRVVLFFSGGLVAKVFVPILGVAVLVGLVAVALLRRRDRRTRTPEPNGEAGDAILNQIAALDDEHASGAVPNDDYSRRRRELLARLKAAGGAHNSPGDRMPTAGDGDGQV